MQSKPSMIIPSRSDAAVPTKNSGLMGRILPRLNKGPNSVAGSNAAASPFDGAVVGTFPKRALSILGMAANANGAATKKQAALVRDMMGIYAMRSFSDFDIQVLLGGIAPPTREDDYRALGLGLSQPQREELMRGVISVVTTHGEASKEECRYIVDLYTGLGISVTRFEMMVDDILGKMAQAA